MFQENAIFLSLRRLVPMRRAFALCLVAVLIGSVFLFQRREEKAKAAPLPFKALVSVTQAQQRDVDIYLPALGTVTSLNTVTVHSRVDGQLMEIHFREGDMVQEGDLLAVVDPRPFQAQLEQAEGQLIRDQALLANARTDLKRYAQLVPGDMIAKQQYDTQAALVRQYEGAVKSDQGILDAARLQLAYSRITAPVSGRTGLRLMDAGNIILASGQSGIVVITQLRPISVVFTLPEDNILKVQEKMSNAAPLKVDAYNREQTQLLASGGLAGLDNQIDPATGTLRLKAQFINDDMRLFPNQFVNVRLLIDTIKNAVVLPAAAVQRGPQGAQSYIVREDNTVELRKVEIAESIKGEIVIRSGVAAGERAVIEGMERLREGSQVEIKQ